MAKIATKTWEGASGQEYSFDVYNGYPVKFSKAAAVYVISNRHQKTGSWHHTPIYVGQTEDISERFDSHHKHQCFVNNNANCVSLHLEGNEKTRLAIESDLLGKWNPPCND